MSDKNKTMATDGTIDCFAKLNNVPTSPRKMRLVVDNIRGMEVTRALGILRFSSRKASATRLLKLLQSAIANWEQVNGRKTEEGELYISRVFVDGGATLKRLRPAPQGRGYRIRKRSNHVTLYVSSLNNANNQKQDGTED
ncbi:50S ribosomal protein L22 [Porphyromonas endodontalis]|jgi:ribosomal protein L22|uniref:Large ribosomal subunit protein uL22 n=1 Tax=Porphyromonas endodontalis (strain ATCC 35406 / DSM 24491 / JCM 8526 / CCUG 16442 / BCRC 14492 / NCTC 13058 / HG 370) TaxID=553175 RepID=C3JAH1_POREA|nr:50S ribosomal protein L22 [Porphyromonas endodontalis]EEN82807.1 ribosomal protein L22 [Porphyromonas endodontalis ATCC 35406]UBH65068.1 50S ribosomal protein L22 [Porphyromonas endodontalis]